MLTRGPRYEPVAFSLLLLLVRRLIELLGVCRLSGSDKDVEILVLRHQLRGPAAASTSRTATATASSWPPWTKCCVRTALGPSAPRVRPPRANCYAEHWIETPAPSGRTTCWSSLTATSAVCSALISGTITGHDRTEARISRSWHYGPHACSPRRGSSHTPLSPAPVGDGPWPATRALRRLPRTGPSPAGMVKFSGRRPCCAGTGTWSPGPGFILAVSAQHPTLSTRPLSTSSCAWPGKTHAGAISAMTAIPNPHSLRSASTKLPTSQPPLGLIMFSFPQRKCMPGGYPAAPRSAKQLLVASQVVGAGVVVAPAIGAVRTYCVGPRHTH